MKIGILTLPFNNNYGGYLQCYALMKTLEDLGHEVVVVYRRHNQNRDFNLALVKAFINNVVRGKHTAYNTKTYESNHKFYGGQMYEEIMPLLSPLTKPVYTTEELSLVCKNNFDAIVVGSDQIWRPDYVPDVREFFLNFTNGWNIKRVAYAASYGTNEPEFTNEQIQECSELLRQFDAVSVREESAVTLTEQMFSFPSEKIKSVLDPTMLLNAEDYNKTFNVDTQQENICFCYFLDNDKGKMKQAQDYADANDLTLKIIDRTHKPCLSISYWLSCFAKAKIVLTDSFHGTVFSILYNKPFYTIQNKERGNARLEDLLAEFELSSRLVNVVVEECNVMNWEIVNKILLSKKTESVSYLRNCL